MGKPLSKVWNGIKKAAEFVVEAVKYVGEFFNSFNLGGQRAIYSSANYESPPITQNEVALEKLSKELSNYGLDHIAYAFVRGVRVDMYCSNFGGRLSNIDELCYCPIAEDKCHHRKW
ncbi:hypothetical protein niasHT_026998 [Heterodera trifolii]|uniref:Uncharacterized protein n=1 Tax=Heterodera trifolii TaxID=157864 RepID=A0ABD2JIW1_9BILA